MPLEVGTVSTDIRDYTNKREMVIGRNALRSRDSFNCPPLFFNPKLFLIVAMPLEVGTVSTVGL